MRQRNRWSSTWTAIVAALLVCAVSLAMASPASATIPAGNLLQNPGAEAGTGSASGDDVEPIPGWTTTSNFTVVQYGTSSSFPTTAFSSSIGGGANFFAGGQNDASSTATQSIDVSGVAAEIDTGGVAATLAGQLGGWESQEDNMVVSAIFLNGSGGTLGQSSIGPVTAADRASQTGMVGRSKTATLPAGTRTIRVVQTATRVSGSYNDGYADNLSLTLASTGRSLTGLVVEQQLFAPGAGTDKDLPVPHASVKLMDGSSLVASTTSRSDGSYLIGGLSVCHACTVAVAKGGVVQDREPVEIGTETPRVHRVDLSFGRLTHGGYLDGEVLMPPGLRSTPLKPPRLIEVRVLNGRGRVIADTGHIMHRCSYPVSGPCPGTARLGFGTFRVARVPAGVPLRVELLEDGVAVDEVRLAARAHGASASEVANGDRVAPPLQGVSAPHTSHGRFLTGLVVARAVFGPGDGNEAPPVRAPHSTVRLTNHGNVIAHADMDREGNYLLGDLPACHCTLELLARGKVSDRRKVRIGGSSANAQRQDLELDRLAAGSFLDGTVLKPPTFLSHGSGQQGPRHVDVRVLDSHGRTLVDSSKVNCSYPGLGSCSPRRRGLYGAFRLGHLPSHGKVRVELLEDRIPVDEQTVKLRSESRAGSTGEGGGSRVVEEDPLDVMAQDLQALGTVPRASGRSLTGLALERPRFAPGADPSRVLPARHSSVQLLKAGQVAGSAMVQADGSYEMEDLPSCSRCKLRLKDRNGILQDELSVTLDARKPRALRSDLDLGRLTHRAVLTGTALTPPGTLLRTPRVSVRILDSHGKVLVDSAKLASRCSYPVSGPCLSGVGSVGYGDYRLGGLPGSGTLRVLLLENGVSVDAVTVPRRSSAGRSGETGALGTEAPTDMVAGNLQGIAPAP